MNPVEGMLQDRILNVVPFMVLLLPLLGFVVLALFGDAIREQEREARQSQARGGLEDLKRKGTLWAGLIACGTVIACKSTMQ